MLVSRLKLISVRKYFTFHAIVMKIVYYYIQNSMNEIVYKSVLPGNSIEYAVCLSILDKGRFEMVLESKSWAYEGSFNI